MAKTYVYIDGEKVAIGTANAFLAMAADFHKAFPKKTLHIRSAIRSWNRQYALWLNYRNGGTYALHPNDPNAMHVETNPRGSRALDLYDSGSEPGVTVAGTPEANWIKNNASKYMFWARGYNFDEPWHVEFQGDPWHGKLVDVAGNVVKKTIKEIKKMALHGMSLKRGSTYDVTIFSENGFEFSYVTNDAAINNDIAKFWGTKSFIKTGNTSMLNKLRKALSIQRSGSNEYDTVT